MAKINKSETGLIKANSGSNNALVGLSLSTTERPEEVKQALGQFPEELQKLLLPPQNWISKTLLNAILHKQKDFFGTINDNSEKKQKLIALQIIVKYVSTHSSVQYFPGFSEFIGSLLEDIQNQINNCENLVIDNNINESFTDIIIEEFEEAEIVGEKDNTQQIENEEITKLRKRLEEIENNQQLAPAINNTKPQEIDQQGDFMNNIEKSAHIIKAILSNDISLRLYLSKLIKDTSDNINQLKELTIDYRLQETLQTIDNYFTNDIKTAYNNLGILVNSSKNTDQKEEIIDTIVQLINTTGEIFNHLNVSKEKHYKYGGDYKQIFATCKNISDMWKRELNIDKFGSVSGYMDNWSIEPSSKAIKNRLEKKFKLPQTGGIFKSVTNFINNLNK